LRKLQAAAQGVVLPKQVAPLLAEHQLPALLLVVLLAALAVLLKQAAPLLAEHQLAALLLVVLLAALAVLLKQAALQNNLNAIALE
jgi:hypothetical protein